jgi:hypothetical protein
MRRDSSTVVAVVGQLRRPVLAELGRSANVAVVEPERLDPEPQAQAEEARTQPPDLDAAAAALAAAGRKPTRYVLVAADPLAALAAQWQAMWNLSPAAATGFEARAADLLSAWHARRFELPDYYLVVAPVLSEAAEPDLYLGPLRATRPHRVEVVAADDEGEQASGIRRALGQLRHGPWWPPLDEIIDIARGFFPGGQPVP